MMKQYRNEKTGAVIETCCIVSGGDWVEVTPPRSAPEAPKKGRVKKDDELRDD